MAKYFGAQWSREEAWNLVLIFKKAIPNYAIIPIYKEIETLSSLSSPKLEYTYPYLLKCYVLEVMPPSEQFDRF